MRMRHTQKKRCMPMLGYALPKGEEREVRGTCAHARLKGEGAIVLHTQRGGGGRERWTEGGRELC